jgi:4-hydroxy-tetrahydrodipicolinate synthase
MVRSALAGDYASALRQHRRLYPMFRAIFVEPNPVPIKAALARAGVISSPEVRLPLCEMAAGNRALLNSVIAALRR